MNVLLNFAGSLSHSFPPSIYFMHTSTEDATVSPLARMLMHFVEYLGLARVGSTFMNHPHLVFSCLSILHSHPSDLSLPFFCTSTKYGCPMWLVLIPFHSSILIIVKSGFVGEIIKGLWACLDMLVGKQMQHNILFVIRGTANKGINAFCS